ncbi:hypothetical protein JK386_05720 [Nocardioides sp. zg-536]|uniref:Uncharacterized protein n=1 Tax=Nocardioides faecalis TaxID=2803858 RepID=A0A938XZJ1_9ACTN|nr:hypothetical protein [Nocardioides faecalis]MBM9459392.1 hypothetical protein [Nocardioides faecalis]QVI59499.1 hypothetical protein KG111_03795 [Nocardioides faecalis]
MRRRVRTRAGTLALLVALGAAACGVPADDEVRRIDPERVPERLQPTEPPQPTQPTQRPPTAEPTRR